MADVNSDVQNIDDNHTKDYRSFQQNLNFILSIDAKIHNSVYRIPDYQRGYAWEERQVRELWEDILALFYDDENQKHQKHYTGMIVLDPIKNHDEKEKLSIEYLENQTNAYYVVDGQQRLTTLIIFLNYIIKALNSSVDENSKDNTDYFIYTGEGIPFGTYRFGYCNSDLNTYFVERVYKNTKKPPHDIYQKNINFACNFSERVMHRFDKESLEKIRKIILEDVIFNIYGITDDFDVRTTFETMNNRGKQLSTLELLKNRLMYLAGKFTTLDTKGLINKIDSAWNTIYKNLSISSDLTLNDDDFLRAHWFLYHKATKLKGDSFRSEIFDDYFKVESFSEKIRKSSNEPAPNAAYLEILKYVESLEKCSAKWAYINDQTTPHIKAQVEPYFDDGYKDKTITMIKRLSHIPNQGGSKYLYPILMGTIYQEPEHPKLRYEFYCDLERYIFLNSCVVYTTKNDLSGFIKYLHPMIHGTNYEGASKSADNVFEDLSKALKESFYSPTQLFKSDNIEKTISSIKVNFLDNCFNKNDKCFYSWNGLKYFLFDYDESLKKDKNEFNEWADLDLTSIEHIFPETPLSTRFNESKKYWKKTFQGFLPNENNKKENERNRVITHMLGNLVLLKDCKENSSISNRSFPVKCGGGSCLERIDKKLPSKKFTYSDSFKSAKKIVTHYCNKVVRGHFFPEDVINRTKDLLDYLWGRWIQNIDGNSLTKAKWISIYSSYLTPLKDVFISDHSDKTKNEYLKECLDNLVAKEIKNISPNDWDFSCQLKSMPYNVRDGLEKYYFENEFNVEYRTIYQNKNEEKYFKSDCYFVLTKYFNNKNVNRSQIERVVLLIKDGDKKMRFSWDAVEENGSIVRYDWNADNDTESYVASLKFNNKVKGFVNCFKSFGEEEQRYWIQEK